MDTTLAAPVVAPASAPPVAVAAAGEYLSLRLGAEEYGIDILRVQEIRSYETPTHIANSPAYRKGVVNLRGVIVPVVDLGRALGGAPIADAATSRIAIVEIDGLVFGLRADAAAEVLAVPGSSVQSPPALVAQSGYDAIRAVVRRPDLPPVLVLALESVLETVYRSKLREIPKEAA